MTTTEAVVRWVVLGAYISLAAELLTVSVPSVASTRQLLRQRPPVARKLWHIATTAAAVVAYCVPLASAILPNLGPVLFKLTGPPRVWRLGLAFAAILGGRLITFPSVLQLRGAWSAGKVGVSVAGDKTDSALATRGLYRFVRNPGLTGMFLAYLGFLLACPSLVVSIGAVIYVWHMHSRVRMEEARLRLMFGQAYRRYQQYTGRYLPRLRRT